MKKREYKKPEIKEVKLSIQDTLLTACRADFGSRVNTRRGNRCSSCRTTYAAS